MKSEWKTIKAKEFCYYVTDGTHDSPKAKEDGHYLITSKHLSPYAIDFFTAKQISKEDYQKIIKRSPVEQWDILFSMIGTIGITYIENNTDISYACKNMGIFKFNGDKDKAYWLYYYLQTPQAKEYISSHLRGTTQQYIPLSSLRDLPIQVPPVKLCNKITSVLKNIDDKIALNNKINKNLEEQAKTIFKYYFSDFKPDGVLSNIADITMGQSPKGTSYNDKKTGIMFFQGKTDFGYRFPNERIYTTEPKKFAEKNDILISVRAPVGDLNIADKKCCIGRGLAALRSKNNCQSFLFYTLKNVKSKLDMFNGEGTVFGSINQKSLKELPVAIPPYSLIEEFEKIVSETDKMIENNCFEIKALSTLRGTLLPELMNGKIDLSEIKI